MDLIVGLAGGAIGAVLAGMGFILLRLASVPSDVARHDRRVAAIDEDLERWVADEHRKLRQELLRVTSDYAAKGLLASSLCLGRRGEEKTLVLQRYRDRRSESERALADLIAEEGWPHELWRRCRKLSGLALSAPDRVEPVIDEWRVTPSLSDMTNHEKVYDPTHWTTPDLLADIVDRPLEGEVVPLVRPPFQVEVHSAWRPSSPALREEPDIFEATVVAINISNQPLYVEALGVIAATEPAWEARSYRREGDVREVPAGGVVSLVVSEDMTDFNMRSGVRGFAQLTTGFGVYGPVCMPTAPTDVE